MLNENQINVGADIIDVCGTGGDKANTFNISTLTAIVSSSCGAKVIKHSGRSTTSITGSVDILDSYGISFDLSDSSLKKVFNNTGLMFVASKQFRNIFGKAKAISKENNIPSFVNLLGPLTNPFKTDYQLLGVSNLTWGNLLIKTLHLQKKKNALVVCSEITSKEKNFFLDELSFCGKNYIWSLNESSISEFSFLPEYFEEQLVDLNLLQVNSKSESKDIFEGVLGGNKDPDFIPKIKIVCLNTAFVLFASKKVKSASEGYEIALESIKSGNAWEHFHKYINSINEMI